MSPPSARSRSGSTSSRGPDSRLVLASASPRRREILTKLGVEFEVVVTDVSELREGDPHSVVLENAHRKASAGHRLSEAPQEALVIGVDTDVSLDGRLLGKPDDVAGARERITALSGRAHEVLSGVAVLGTGIGTSVPVERSAVATTTVTFRELDEATIELYLDSGEWHDRAGAYAIQGLGSILVSAIEGDFSNVVGLPVATLLELIPGLLD